MEARSLEFIATACAGELLSGSPETCAHRVGTDSRRVQAGDLFIALPGGRFDGHDFLRQAAENGAAGDHRGAPGPPAIPPNEKLISAPGIPFLAASDR